MVSVCGGLLQVCMGDVHLFWVTDTWLEKVRHKEDLQGKVRDMKDKDVNGGEQKIPPQKSRIVQS